MLGAVIGEEELVDVSAMRGINNPELVLVISSLALDDGVLVPIPTFWENVLNPKINEKKINRPNKFKLCIGGR